MENCHFSTSKKKVWLKEGKRVRKVLDHNDHEQSIVAWSDHTMWVSPSPPPPAPPQQDCYVNLSSSAFLNPPLPLGIPISPPHQPHPQAIIMADSLGGIVCFLLTHEILSTRQYMVAGLEKGRDTERSKHTAIQPAVPSPCPPHLLWHSKANQFWRSTFRKETYFVLQKSRFEFLVGF